MRSLSLALQAADWLSAWFGLQVLEAPPNSSVVVVDAAATRREKPPAKEMLRSLP